MADTPAFPASLDDVMNHEARLQQLNARLPEWRREEAEKAEIHAGLLYLLRSIAEIDRPATERALADARAERGALAEAFHAAIAAGEPAEAAQTHWEALYAVLRRVDALRAELEHLIAMQEELLPGEIAQAEKAYNEARGRRVAAGQAVARMSDPAVLEYVCGMRLYHHQWLVQLREQAERERIRAEHRKAAEESARKKEETIRQCIANELKEFDEEQNCKICLAHIAEYPRKATQCGHVFHRDCIDGWLRQSRLCPVCRTEQIEELDINAPSTYVTSSGRRTSKPFSYAAAEADDDDPSAQKLVSDGAGTTMRVLSDAEMYARVQSAFS